MKRKLPAWLDRLADSEKWLGRSFLAPAVVYIFALIGLPFLLAVAYSFTNVSISSAAGSWVGLTNFRRAVEDPTFRRALLNTFLFAVVS